MTIDMSMTIDIKVANRKPRLLVIDLVSSRRMCGTNGMMVCYDVCSSELRGKVSYAVYVDELDSIRSTQLSIIQTARGSTFT